MELEDIKQIESVEQLEDGRIKIVVIMDKKAMAEKFAPYYTIQDDIRKAILPVMVEEVLKNKEAIVADVLKNVNWPEIVRSEVAQKVIKQIATGNNY